MTSGTLETLVQEARQAALTGGLTGLRGMTVRVGPDCELSADEILDALRSLVGGPLFEGCEISTIETTEGSVSLASIEGWVAEEA